MKQLWGTTALWKTKEGTPNLGSLCPIHPLPCARQPNMHHLFSRQHQCSRRRLQDVCIAPAPEIQDQCVGNKLTHLGGRGQIYSINGGGSIAPNLPPIARGNRSHPLVPNQCWLCAEWYCMNIKSKTRRNAIQKCWWGKVSVCVAWMPLLPHQRCCAPLNRLDDYFLYIRDSYPQTEL